MHDKNSLLPNWLNCLPIFSLFHFWLCLYFSLAHHHGSHNVRAWTKSKQRQLIWRDIFRPLLELMRWNSFMFVWIAFWNAPVIFCAISGPLWRAKAIRERSQTRGSESAHENGCSHVPKVSFLYRDENGFQLSKTLIYSSLISRAFSFRTGSQEIQTGFINYDETFFDLVRFQRRFSNLHLADG